MALVTEKLSPRNVGGNGYGGNSRKKKRPTYSQDWPNYRFAEKYDVDFFRLFLSDMMDLIPEPRQTSGRPRHKLGDVMKALAIKVHSTMSTGRSQTAVRDAWRLGYLDKIPGANTIIDYMNMPEITPILRECIEFTAAVLSPYESHFSPDSSGFRTTSYMRWFEEKWVSDDEPQSDDGGENWVERKKREWRKVHIVVGTNTQVVVGVVVEGYESSDYKQFIPMFDRIRKLFDVETISGDAAYAGHSNYNAAENWGATAFLPFHRRHVRPSDSDQSAWAKAYRMFYDNREEWNLWYHRRSIVETGFSTVKRLYGETIRSKNLDAQVNELLLKFICHNIKVLVHEMFELGVYPFFANDARFIYSLPHKDRAKLLEKMNGVAAHPHWPIEDSQFRYFSRPQPPQYTNGVNGHHDPTRWPNYEVGSGW